MREILGRPSPWQHDIVTQFLSDLTEVFPVLFIRFQKLKHYIFCAALKSKARSDVKQAINVNALDSSHCSAPDVHRTSVDSNFRSLCLKYHSPVKFR